MKLSSAIAGGVTGAIALTLIHETLRRINPKAPRMDLLGMQALAKSLIRLKTSVPDRDKLFNITMAGDLVSNSAYYSLAGIGGKRNIIIRGFFLGLAAGFGAVYLPKPLGLNDAPAARTLQTKLLTVALYSSGGLIAAATSKLLEDKG